MVPMLTHGYKDKSTGTYRVRPTTPDVKLPIDPHFPEMHHSIYLTDLAACLPGCFPAHISHCEELTKQFHNLLVRTLELMFLQVNP